MRGRSKYSKRRNKKFWEELIARFRCISDIVPNRKKISLRVSNEGFKNNTLWETVVLVLLMGVIHEMLIGMLRNAYRLLMGKPKGKRPLGRPRRRWVDNIRMDLGEVGWVMWTGLIWLRIGTGGELL
jgi:hypothetical protein